MFPLFVDIAELPVALAGEGPLVARRLALLDEAGAGRVRVFAPDADAALREAAGDRLTPRLPEAGEIEAAALLFLAGLDPEAAEPLVRTARAAKTWVNTEDVRPLCDFHVPATLRRGALTLAVSTAGKSPGLARALKRWLGDKLPADWDARLELLAEARAAWRAEGLSLGEVAARTEALIEEKGWLR